MTAERWVPIPDFPGYEVSDLGRVRSLATPATRKRGRILKPSRTVSGNDRVAVGLYRDGKRHMRLVHRIVLEAFVGPRPEGMECCHFDDDPTNNSLENLRWDTRTANRQDMLRNKGHWNSRKTECIHGHRFTPENTYITKRGRRHCKACIDRRQRSRRSKSGVSR